MSADEKTYIEAKLEDLQRQVGEVHTDVRHINGSLSAIAVQQVAIAGRMSSVEEDARKNHCPRAGLCIKLEDEIKELKSRISVYDSDKKAAFSVWKVIVGTLVFLAGVGGFIYTVIEIGKSAWTWFHK